MLSGDMALLRVATVPEPRRRPAATLICWKEPYQPRFPSGAHSTMNAVDPPHSPPALKPCMRRAIRITAGPAMPTAAYEGASPMRTVPAAMRKMVMSSAAFRPFTSPMRPMMTPPRGRARNPTPNTANDAINSAEGSPEGKNVFPRMPARKEYTAKSYHSRTLPITAAVTARRAFFSRAGAAVGGVLTTPIEIRRR